MEDYLWGFAGLEGLFDADTCIGEPLTVLPADVVSESLPQVEEASVTEMVVSGAASGSGGVVRVQRGWSEESGYRSLAPTSPSEGSEVSLTELGAATPAGTQGDLTEKFLKGACPPPKESKKSSRAETPGEEEENEMVLVPSGKS